MVNGASTSIDNPTRAYRNLLSIIIALTGHGTHIIRQRHRTLCRPSEVRTLIRYRRASEACTILLGLSLLVLISDMWTWVGVRGTCGCMEPVAMQIGSCKIGCAESS